jgi:hypothetical protein
MQFCTNVAAEVAAIAAEAFVRFADEIIRPEIAPIAGLDDSAEE